MPQVLPEAALQMLERLQAQNPDPEYDRSNLERIVAEAQYAARSTPPSSPASATGSRRSSASAPTTPPR
jgi:hypothetical protein